MVTVSAVVVQLVNLTDGLVHLQDGRTWPITAWLDVDADPIPTMVDAHWFVAGKDGEGYIIEAMADYRACVLQ